MTAILRDASGKMHHGILFDPPLSVCKLVKLILYKYACGYKLLVVLR